MGRRPNVHGGDTSTRYDRQTGGRGMKYDHCIETWCEKVLSEAILEGEEGKWEVTAPTGQVVEVTITLKRT